MDVPGQFLLFQVETYPKSGGMLQAEVVISSVFVVFLAPTKQLYEWCSPSARPPARLSVCVMEYWKPITSQIC